MLHREVRLILADSDDTSVLARAGELSSAQIQEIVDRHNELRRGEGASNMEVMVRMRDRASFLPLERGYCCRSVALWLSVCLSVTLMYCAQTTESTIMRSSRECSPAILVFPYQI